MTNADDFEMTPHSLLPRLGRKAARLFRKLYFVSVLDRYAAVREVHLGY